MGAMSLSSPPMAAMLATLLREGYVLLRSQAHPAAKEACHVELILVPGESFGGHSFAEWLAVAKGPGVVNADWLDV